MALTAGTVLGPYRVLSALGAGGMGEVYRALDTRLGREVAVKVLPPDVAHDPMRLERFAREARAAAALNHPNILAVHDVASDGDVHYLVSELLDGQSLADRLQPGAGALSVRKATDLAQQIAQGLAAAHARGIVHRDLKPANVFVTADGRAKILDFGLAKQSAPIDAGLTTTGAGASPDTGPGQVLGTVGYMAPEQVRGQTVDARADLFAFGALLYEMLAGRRAFQGDSAADTISAILGKDPPDLVSSPDHLIPPALHRIVGRCLEKDPAARFQSAADLAFALQALTTESTQSHAEMPVPTGADSPRGSGPRLREAVVAALGLAGLAAAGLSWTYRPSTPSSAPPVTAQFEADLPLGIGNSSGRVAVSPDGRWVLVYTGNEYWVYSLSDGSTISLGAGQSRGGAIWAPDSSAVALTRAGGAGLMLFRLQDQSTTPLSDIGVLAFPVTGAWSLSGELVVADGAGRVMVVRTDAPERPPRILREGGASPRVVAGFLPGRSTFISVNDAGPAGSVGMFRSTTDGAIDDRIDDSPWDSAAVIDSTTVLAKRGPNLFEIRLDAQAQRVVGAPRFLTASVGPNALRWSASSAVLAHFGVVSQRFHWFSRAGAERTPVGPVAIWESFDMNADGSRVVALRQAPGGSRQQSLWQLDLVRGVEDRLTFAQGRDGDPAVSTDGSQAAFVSGDSTNSTTRAYIVEPGRQPELAFEDPAGVALDDWSPDLRWFVYHHRTAVRSETGLLVVPRNASAPPRSVARCQDGLADEARVAPRGQWLAFNCNESGRDEVYVVSFPDGGSRVRVSQQGGVQPAWKGDESELYYLEPDGGMMSATVRTAPRFAVSHVRRLFDTPLLPSSGGEQYRVTADGQRFLILLPEAGPQRLRVIVNWRERFKADQSAGQ